MSTRRVIVRQQMYHYVIHDWEDEPPPAEKFGVM